MFNNDRKLASILKKNKNKTVIFQTKNGKWGRFNVMWNKSFSCQGGSEPEQIGIHREDLTFKKSSTEETHDLTDALGVSVLEMYVINYSNFYGQK